MASIIRVERISELGKTSIISVAIVAYQLSPSNQKVRSCL
jgi:hypothetical protein